MAEAKMDIEAEIEELLGYLQDTPDPSVLSKVKEWDTAQSTNFLLNARDGFFSPWAKDFEMNGYSFKEVMEFDLEYDNCVVYFAEPEMTPDQFEELKKCFDGTYSWEQVYEEFAEWIIPYKELTNKPPSPSPPPPPTISVLVQRFDNIQNASAIRDIITFQTDSVRVRPQVITVVRKTAVLQFANAEEAARYKQHFETSENHQCTYPQHLEEFPELNENRDPPLLDPSTFPVVPKQLEPLEPTPPASPEPEVSPEPDWDLEYPMPELKLEEVTESRSGLMDALRQVENDEHVREYPCKPAADVYGVFLSGAKNLPDFSLASLRKEINTILEYPSDFQQNMVAIGEEVKQQAPEGRKNKQPSRGRGRRKRRKTPPPQVGGQQGDQKEGEAVVDERQYQIDVKATNRDVLVYFSSRARQQEFMEKYNRMKNTTEASKLGFGVKLAVMQDDHKLELELATPKLLEAVSEFGTILSYRQDHSTRELNVTFETLEAVQILAHYNRIQLGPGEYIVCSHLPEYVKSKPVYRTMKDGWKNTKNILAEDADALWEKREEDMHPVDKIMSIGYVETRAQAQAFFDKHLSECGGDQESAVERAIQDITMTRYNSSQMCLPFTPQRDRNEDDDPLGVDQVR